MPMVPRRNATNCNGCLGSTRLGCERTLTQSRVPLGASPWPGGGWGKIAGLGGGVYPRKYFAGQFGSTREKPNHITRAHVSFPRKHASPIDNFPGLWYRWRMDAPTDAWIDELAALPPSERPSGRVQIQKVRYTHEDCIDLILAQPGISQNELAARYGYSPAWISVVINSDAFQSRLAARRAELVDPVLAATLNERFRALTVRSLEVLQEKLSLPSQAVPDQLALQAAALGAKSLGLGVPQVQAAPASDNLAVLAERLRTFVRRTQTEEVVDVTVREVVR